MSDFYDTEFRCKSCKRRYATLDELKRHFRREHGKGKLFRCDHCDYTSIRKGDVARHCSRRHPESQKGESAPSVVKPASTSKGQRTPPKIQRKHLDWPSLNEILGSPHSVKDLREQHGSNPPTPYATPLRRPESADQKEGAVPTEASRNGEDVLGDRQQPGPQAQVETREGPQSGVIEQTSQTNCDTGETSRESARHDTDGEVGNDTAVRRYDALQSIAVRPVLQQFATVM
ncbi:hypothetical protein HOLleu_44302 [Holothuria leucospilota]|uniref:C2H2-type domain-containing protein n=1 Tax=Holothuria leucospilota TaxID=206669 RepID=A0A9Q0Y8Y1_HOLLE|nr:hypothetical protein HOLleu_44302 [Holothuria leucospilota]